MGQIGVKMERNFSEISIYIIRFGYWLGVWVHEVQDARCKVQDDVVDQLVIKKG